MGMVGRPTGLVNHFNLLLPSQLDQFHISIGGQLGRAGHGQGRQGLFYLHERRTYRVVNNQARQGIRTRVVPKIDRKSLVTLSYHKQQFLGLDLVTLDLMLIV